MPRSIALHIKEKLDDKQWLVDMHVNQLFSITELSGLLGVTPSIVRRALKTHNISSPDLNALRAASNLRKYGTANVGSITRDKALATMQAKYGGHNLAKSGNRSKRDAIMVERYGATNVGGNPEFVEKAKQTSNQRYGRNHFKQSHITDAAYEKLLNAEWLSDKHLKEKLTLSQIAVLLDVDMTTIMNHCRKHDIKTQNYCGSIEEDQLVEAIAQFYAHPIVRNDRSIIAPYELDIVLPAHKIAIEYCGLYWHTHEAGKGRYYHKTKWEKCRAQGFRLFTIYSDEWKRKRNVVIAALRRALNEDVSSTVGARQCRVITNTDLTSLMNTHHIQGYKAGTVSYALEYQQQLVAGLICKRYKQDWYIERFATSCKVPGAFTKLLAQFVKDWSPTEIITFADLRWSNGDLYHKTGFTNVATLKPDYEYVVGDTRSHKFNFRHSQLRTKLPNYDPNLSEVENAENHGYQRIWDCGKLRFILRQTSES